MNWKSEAVDKLRKYDVMCNAVRSIPVELDRLEKEARALRSVNPSKILVRSGSNRHEDALLDNIVHRQELEYALEQAQLWVQTTQQAINILCAEDRQLLQNIFICPAGNVQQLCAQMGMEKSTLYRKRDAALQKFTLALYGVLES